MPIKISEGRKNAIKYELFYRCVLGEDSIRTVAEKHHISHTTAYQILNDLRRDPHAISLRPAPFLPIDDELRLAVEARLRPHGIERCVIVPTPADDSDLDSSKYRHALRNYLGAAAARFLVEEVEPPIPIDIMIGGGRTMMSFADAYTSMLLQNTASVSGDRPFIVIRPLASGGRWRAISHADATSVVQLMFWKLAEGLGASSGAIRAVCPELSPRLLRDRAAGQYPELDLTFGPPCDLFKAETTPVAAPRIIITSIGRRRFADNGPKRGPHPDTSAFIRLAAESRFYQAQSGHLDAKDMIEPLDSSIYRALNDELVDKHIVTDVGRYAVDENGDPHDGYLDRSSLLFPWRVLQGWGSSPRVTSIVVTGGSMLVHAFKAAMRTRVFNTCVIDTSLAVQLVEHNDLPMLYKNVPRVGQLPRVGDPELFDPVTNERVIPRRSMTPSPLVS